MSAGPPSAGQRLADLLSPEAVAAGLVVVVALVAGGLALGAAQGSGTTEASPSVPAATLVPTAAPSPATGSAAIDSALTINARLLDAAAELDDALAAIPVDVARVTAAIRQVNGQVRIGLGVVLDDLAGDPTTGAVGAQLETAWTQAAETCRDLLATASSSRAQGAAALVAEIEALEPIDEQLRALAPNP